MRLRSQYISCGPSRGCGGDGASRGQRSPRLARTGAKGRVGRNLLGYDELPCPIVALIPIDPDPPQVTLTTSITCGQREAAGEPYNYLDTTAQVALPEALRQ